MEYPILNLPLDETGVEESHYREETHPVSIEQQYIVYPTKGPYFTGSMVVFDQAGNELKRDIDWEPMLHYQEATLDVGQSIHRCLVIKQNNPSVPVVEVKIEHQLVGGIYTNDNIAFAELLEMFKKQKSVVNWDDVIKPEDGFKANLHFHNVDADLMGTQEVVEAINAVATVVQDFLNRNDFEIADIINLQEELDELKAKDKSQDNTITQLQQNLTELIEEHSNRFISANGSTCSVVRNSVTTTVDKDDAVDCSIVIDDTSEFLVNDTIEINVGNFNVGSVNYSFANDGVFRDLTGNDTTSISSTGNHYITLRCIGKTGNTTIMKIVKVV